MYAPNYQPGRLHYNYFRMRQGGEEKAREFSRFVDGLRPELNRKLRHKEFVSLTDKKGAKKFRRLYQGPFRVVEILTPQTMRVQPTKGSKPAFIVNVSRVKRFAGKDTDLEPEEFEVEKITAHREGTDGLEFRVRWKNYTARYDSWVRADDLHAPALLQEYWAGAEESEAEEDDRAEHTMKAVGTTLPPEEGPVVSVMCFGKKTQQRVGVSPVWANKE